MEHVTEQQLTRQQSPVWRALRAAAPQTIPVLAGYFVLGMGYGIYVQSLGLPVWMPMLMGTVVYGGSLEFVLASLLLSAFSPLSAFLMALMIQARHLFYGLAMLERYKGYGLRSFYMIFAMSDETFSITCSAEPPAGVDKGWFMFFITLLDQFYWVASAGLGAAVGSILPFSTEGVDFVMTAMFTVIFLNQWEKSKQHYSAFIGLAAPLVCLAIFGSGSFLLPSMGCILVLLLAQNAAHGRSRKEKRGGGRMTALQMGLTIAVCTAATMITRFLPFVVFSSKDQQPPEVVRYLGRVLPAAIFGMLIVYCLKSVTPFAGSHGIPEAIALLVTVALHKWKHETLLSVAGGTLCYVLLVQLVF